VPDSRAPEYIVVFHSTVDAEQEAARLAAAYGFHPRYVWAAALEGFSAELTPETVAEIRCEPAVDYVEHDQVISLD
jgi:hypothetical protein